MPLAETTYGGLREDLNRATDERIGEITGEPRRPAFRSCLPHGSAATNLTADLPDPTCRVMKLGNWLESTAKLIAGRPLAPTRLHQATATSNQRGNR